MANPYYDRQYGPFLSATQGFLNSYMQRMQLEEQFRRQRMDEKYRQSVLGMNQESLALRKQQYESEEQRAQELFPLQLQEKEADIKRTEAMADYYGAGGRAFSQSLETQRNLGNIEKMYPVADIDFTSLSDFISKEINNRKKGFFAGARAGYDFTNKDYQDTRKMAVDVYKSRQKGNIYPEQLQVIDNAIQAAVAKHGVYAEPYSPTEEIETMQRPGIETFGTPVNNIQDELSKIKTAIPDLTEEELQTAMERLRSGESAEDILRGLNE